MKICSFCRSEWCGRVRSDTGLVSCVVDASGTGRKDDGGKAPWRLLPWDALVPVVEVLRRGAIKYEAENWRKVPDWRQRYYDAALRHLVAWRLGESTDPEWKLPHLAHAACCVLFMLALELREEP